MHVSSSSYDMHVSSSSFLTGVVSVARLAETRTEAVSYDAGMLLMCCQCVANVLLMCCCQCVANVLQMCC
jgi:hypothetical protein